MRALILGLILTRAFSGCAFPAREHAPMEDVKASLGLAEKTARTDAPTGRAVGRSQWSALVPGDRVKVVSKTGTYMGGFILYHDGVLWIAVEGGGRKAFDALEVGRLQVLSPQ